MAHPGRAKGFLAWLHGKQTRRRIDGMAKLARKAVGIGPGRRG